MVSLPKFICRSPKPPLPQNVTLFGDMDFLFFSFGCTMACRSSWARDLTCTTAVTQATAVTTLDPDPAELLGNSWNYGL